MSVLLVRPLFVPILLLVMGAMPDRQASPVSPVAVTASELTLTAVTSTLQVDPHATIIRKDGASVSHSGSGTLTVTITGDVGQVATIEVPAGQTVNWIPPDGWHSASFRAEGHQDEFRTIE